MVAAVTFEAAFRPVSLGIFERGDTLLQVFKLGSEALQQAGFGGRRVLRLARPRRGPTPVAPARTAAETTASSPVATARRSTAAAATRAETPSGH